MFKQNPNMSYYEIRLSELHDKKMDVLSFEGEEKISGLFEYRIQIATNIVNLDSSKVLNKPATFTFVRGDETPEKVHGIISNFEQLGRSNNYVFYKLVLVPRLWRLNLIYQNVVYQKMNISNLIREVIAEAGIQGSDFKIELNESYPENEYLVQYRESSFNFLNRKLEHLGIFYYFDHGGDSDTVVFTDSNSALPAIHFSENIEFNENRAQFGDSETIIDLNCTEKVVTGEVKLKDYNYMFPEKQLMAQSKLDSSMPGLFYDFGDNFEDEKEAEFLAKIRNQEFLSQSKIFTGISDSRLLRPGFKFKLKSHFRESWNSEYIILSSSLKGSQPGPSDYRGHKDEKTQHFECCFSALPSGIDYRPPRTTPVPKINGIMSAKIESGSGDEYAFIDDNGRYKAKMLFDLSDKSNGEASLPIRLGQSYTGPGYGIHFPNHKGTELLWACVDGNVERPIGLGTVPNPSQASPVVSKNKMQNIIRTAAGNEIFLDDKIDETQVGFSTADGHKILLDDKDDNISVSTKDKYIMTFDDKNENMKIQSKNGHLLILDDKNEKIEVQSKNGHKISIDDGSGGEKITLADSGDGNTLVIDISNSKIIVKTDNGNIDLHAPNGVIDIKAAELNIETTGDTSLKAANLKTEADVDFKIKASNVTEEASMDLKLKGMNLEAKGDMNVKLEGGMNLEAKGGMAAKVEGGATADFKAGAKASLQAGIVMIN